MAIYNLAPDLQIPEMFMPRKPLSEKARRGDWSVLLYDLAHVRTAFVRLV